jgi:integrase
VDVTQRVGVTELQRSLNTRDFAEARRRCLLATRWFAATMEQMRVMDRPTREHLEAAARSFFDGLAQDIDHPRGFPHDGFRQAVAYNVHLSEERITDLDRQLVSNDFDGEADKLAGEMLTSISADLTELDPATSLLARQLAVRAAREQMRYMIHALTRPAQRFVPLDEIFLPSIGHVAGGTVPSLPIPALVESDPVFPTLTEAAAEYLRRKAASGLGASQVEETARLLEWLKQAIGPLRTVSDIKKHELRTFRDDLQRVNVKLRGMPAPFRDRLTDVPADWVKSATYLRYWNAACAFFAWCYSEGLAATDPSAGLVIEKKKGEEKRTPPPFDQEELRRLFSTPLFAGHQSPKRRTAVGTCVQRGAHWWSAVLMTYTGMRAGELSQLLASDFVFDADVPHLKVQLVDDKGEKVKSAKNKASIRDVPLHPDLLTLGLRQFVEWREKKYPHDRVFWEFRLGSSGKYTDGITRFWKDYLVKFNLWKAGRATHVFRHTLVASLRRQDVAGEDIGAFVGHVGRSVTEGYGGAYPLERKARTAALLNYGFDVVTALGGPFDAKRHLH